MQEVTYKSLPFSSRTQIDSVTTSVQDAESGRCERCTDPVLVLWGLVIHYNYLSATFFKALTVGVSKTIQRFEKSQRHKAKAEG